MCGIKKTDFKIVKLYQLWWWWYYCNGNSDDNDVKDYGDNDIIIAKVMIIKSMIIKMIMMFTMMITIWLNTECSNYSTYIRGGVLDSCHHFVTFFGIYSLTVQEIYYEKEI